MGVWLVWFFFMVTSENSHAFILRDLFPSYLAKMLVNTQSINCAFCFIWRKNLYAIRTRRIFRGSLMSHLNILMRSSCVIFFRHISQKCSSIHKVLTALFASSDEKISMQSERVEYSEVPLYYSRFCRLYPQGGWKGNLRLLAEMKERRHRAFPI